MVHKDNLDLQWALHFIEFFLKDLNIAVMQQEFFNFHEMPQLYTTLYPATAPNNRGLDRTKNNDANTISRNGGGGLGGSSKGGHDLCNSHSQGGDSQQTKNESPNKNKGIFIFDRLPFFKSVNDPDGMPHPPKVTVGGKEMQICVKGSSKDRVCTNDQCKLAHIFILDKITKGVSKLNTWTLDTDSVK